MKRIIPCINAALTVCAVGLIPAIAVYFQQANGVPLYWSAVSVMCCLLPAVYFFPVRQFFYASMMARKPVFIRKPVNIARNILAAFFGLLLFCAVAKYERDPMMLSYYAPIAGSYLLIVVWAIVNGACMWCREKYPHLTMFGGFFK